MKKLKIIALIIFLLVLILIALSFFKLPINTITNNLVKEQTKNNVFLTSSGEQSLILLPKRQIEINDGSFSLSGEDLPEEDAQPEKIIITPTQGAMDTIPEDEQNYLKELAVDLIATCEQGDPKAAWVKLEAENLDSEQKVALWTLLPSKVRSALKKAKEL